MLWLGQQGKETGHSTVADETTTTCLKRQAPIQNADDEEVNSQPCINYGELDIFYTSYCDMNHCTYTVNLRRKIIDNYNHYRQDSCPRNRLPCVRTAKQKSKEACENVPSAAIMCAVCVIVVTVQEGELKIDRCSEISEP